MIEISFENLNNPMFTQALLKIAHHSGFGIKTAYTVSKITQKCERLLGEGRTLYAQLIEKYAERNEFGAIKLDENSKRPVIEKDRREYYAREYQELMGMTFPLNYFPLALEDLEGAGLTPSEVTALEPLLSLNGPSELDQTGS